MAAFGALMRILSGRRRGGERRAPSAGFLARIARSEAGNAMAIMAIGIFPLTGLVGGALDMSRIYLVKTRLQQACDAGALAGRRIMGAGQWSANTNAANRAAEQFFDNNFGTNAYGTTNLTRSFTESAGRVTGTASATVPMTLMRLFGSDQEPVAVACDAEMRLPNTDVMFVLDTTGSMAQTIPGDSSTKINTLRLAVKCFFETVARLDTNADCTPGTPGPTGGTGNQTQIRFGFVPYATNVNVGRLLQNEWLADSWQYQTRIPRTTTVYAWSLGSPNAVSWGNFTNPTPPNPSNYSNLSADVGGFPYIRTGTNSSNCASQAAPASTDVAGTATQSQTGTTNNPPTYPASQQTASYSETVPHTHTRYRYNWNSSNPNGGQNRCHLQRGTSTYNKTRTGSGTIPIIWTQYQRFDGWRYQQASHNISALKAGVSSWNGSVSLPLSTSTVSNIRLSGSSSASTLTIPANATVNWDGCIEERSTVRTTNFSPIPNDAYDLNIDLVPSSGTATSLWGPALSDAVYFRGVRTDGSGNPTTATVDDSGEFLRADQYGYSCGTEGRRLQSWPAASPLETYVDSLTPTGNTYHDIGLIWGARLMSPTGIFASDNALTPAGGEIERHMIFMTDGETCTSEWNYNAYGAQWYDRRQTSASSAPSSGCGDSGTLTQQVNLRFSAVCNAVKNQNITLWVVYFGSTDTNTLNRMTACATPGRFFYANNSAGLVSSFRTIADQISQLRLTR
jgi:Flp pilus assembly protein TadG